MKKHKLKGKGKKAGLRLEAIKEDMDAVIEHLKKSKGKLQDIIKTNFENIYPQSKFLGDFKQRSLMKDIPNRIEFEFNSIKFYIDFTLMPIERDDITEINGSIVYGANRTLCFVCPDKSKIQQCENCERILRCDKLEDKPLIQFLVNRNGIIKSKDKLEDEMWTTENIEDLLELHYRTLDLIWKDALDWANEIIVP